MKICVEKSWKQFFLTGYLYRVSCYKANWIDEDIAISSYDNRFFRMIKDNSWYYRCHLKPEIRLWLEESLPYMSWKAEFPNYQDQQNLGIKFRRKKHIVMFKLVWG